jgi:hypothetical protein
VSFLRALEAIVNARFLVKGVAANAVKEIILFIVTVVVAGVSSKGGQGIAGFVGIIVVWMNFRGVFVKLFQVGRKVKVAERFCCFVVLVGRSNRSACRRSQ